MCAMRRAYRDALKISTVMSWIVDEWKKDFIFLTLTVPNVTAAELPATISEMNKAWHKLVRRRAIADHVDNGFIRKLEVTYDGEPVITRDMWEGAGKHNGKPRAAYYTRKGYNIGDANPNYNTYHPHFHAVIAVNKSYFKSRDYISHAKWLKMWQESMRNPLITQVDVRRIKRHEDAAEMAGGFDVREFAKYAAKDSDYLVDKQVFDTFYRALKGRQAQTFSGLFADGNRRYKAGELDGYMQPDVTEYMYEVFFRWHGNEYGETKRRKLNPKQDWDLVKRGISIAERKSKDTSQGENE